jgi:hypothetical protein
MRSPRAGDVSLLRTFINTRLAETFEEQGDRVVAHELQRRAADIPMGVVVWGLFVRTLGVDVQGDRIEAYDWAWGRGMERQLVDRRSSTATRRCPRRSRAAVGALTEYRRTPVLHASGRRRRCSRLHRLRRPPHAGRSTVYARAHQHAHVTRSRAPRSPARRSSASRATRTSTGGRAPQARRQALADRHRHRQGVIYGRLRLTEPAASPNGPRATRPICRSPSRGCSTRRTPARALVSRALGYKVRAGGPALFT